MKPKFAECPRLKYM